MTGASFGLNRVIFTPEYFKKYPLVSEKNDIPAVYVITKDRSGNIWVGIRGKDPLIKITTDLKSTNLKISEIIMCMADGYCTNFFVTGNRKYVSSRNLKHFEEMLEEQNIIRVHHSYLVNINHVLSYSRQGEILLTEGHKASLGDSYKNNFIKRFGGK
jgi:DNA-binding LytR/AlgR family response regulator